MQALLIMIGVGIAVGVVAWLVFRWIDREEDRTQ